MPEKKINLNEIIAIDVHTHAEVSVVNRHDDYRPEFDEAFAKYFKSDTGQPFKRRVIIIVR
jgi:hypothetical protein